MNKYLLCFSFFNALNKISVIRFSSVGGVRERGGEGGRRNCDKLLCKCFRLKFIIFSLLLQALAYLHHEVKSYYFQQDVLIPASFSYTLSHTAFFQ